MDLNGLLEKIADLSDWKKGEVDDYLEEIYSRKSIDELRADIDGLISNIDYTLENEIGERKEYSDLKGGLLAAKKDLERLIPFYALHGCDDEGNDTIMIFYDIEEAKIEASNWKRSTKNGTCEIFLCLTSEDEIKNILKDIPEVFYKNCDKNPRDTYILSLCLNADMVIN